MIGFEPADGGEDIPFFERAEGGDLPAAFTVSAKIQDEAVVSAGHEIVGEHELIGFAGGQAVTDEGGLGAPLRVGGGAASSAARNLVRRLLRGNPPGDDVDAVGRAKFDALEIVAQFALWIGLW